MVHGNLGRMPVSPEGFRAEMPNLRRVQGYGAERFPFRPDGKLNFLEKNMPFEI